MEDPVPQLPGDLPLRVSRRHSSAGRLERVPNHATQRPKAGLLVRTKAAAGLAQLIADRLALSKGAITGQPAFLLTQLG